MDTLYSRERVDGDRMTPEELLEEAETERDRAKMEVIRLRKIIVESLELVAQLTRRLCDCK